MRGRRSRGNVCPHARDLPSTHPAGAIVFAKQKSKNHAVAPPGAVGGADIRMALSQRLELRQGQALVMTPQLLQAIKLLQLSHAELAAYVENELERNPLLDRAEAEA